MGVLKRFILVAMCVSACSASATAVAGPLPLGVWGGSQGNLTVFADSATLDLPCAGGRIQGALVTASDGTFDLAGLYAIEAGPVSSSGPNWQPARYRGSRVGDDLSMTIVFSNGSLGGPLAFHRGTTGQFARCL
jgi:hypothetical protein